MRCKSSVGSVPPPPCGLSAAIPARKERPGIWALVVVIKEDRNSAYLFFVNTLEGNRNGGFFPGNSTKLAPSMQIGGYKRGKIKFNQAWFIFIISFYF